jgi:hypothetical protein
MSLVVVGYMPLPELFMYAFIKDVFPDFFVPTTAILYTLYLKSDDIYTVSLLIVNYFGPNQMKRAIC